jgi:hypothetical protein
MESVKPLIGISWGNLIISILVIMAIYYLCVKIIKNILKK